VNYKISVIEVHSFLIQSLVNSRSVSEVVVQLRSLFQTRLQYTLSVSEDAFEDSVLCIVGNDVIVGESLEE